MSKALLISVDVKACDKIFRLGHATIKIKGSPCRIRPPFKVYVHEKQHRTVEGIGSGNVVGEFICKNVIYKGDSECELAIICPTYYDMPLHIKDFCRPCGRPIECTCDYCKEHGASSSLSSAPTIFTYVESLPEGEALC